MKLKIRLVEKEDIPSVARLYESFWGEASDSALMKKKLEELKDNPKHILLCAELDQQIAGTIMGIICDDLYGDCRPFLVMENLITDQRYRKQGVGKALLTKLEDFGRSNHCTQIIFITEARRQDAMSFYTSMGYNSNTHIGYKKKLE